MDDLQVRIIDVVDLSLLNSGYHKYTKTFNYLSAGVYFYQFQIDGELQISHKMLLLK